MTDEEIKSFIELAIQKTIKEYKRNGLLKDSDAAVYADASDMLFNYYKNGKIDVPITYAIQGKRFDPYFRIIQLYFEEKKTVEKIAQELAVDVSTVVRNKKRLCLEIYNEIV